MNMPHKNNQPAGELGLVANGSSGKWDVAVDEALDGSAWFLELDGPQAYVVFQLRSPQVVSEAERFLQTCLAAPSAGGRRDAGRELILGQFGSASVSFIGDDEDFPRCFLVVGPKAKSTLRLSLDGDDLRMLTEALNQVVEDLAGAGRE